MKIKYFEDSDTALLEFADRKIEETIEVNENIYLDLDKDGNIVNITVEHAKENTNLPTLSYEEITKEVA